MWPCFIARTAALSQPAWSGSGLWTRESTHSRPCQRCARRSSARAEFPTRAFSGRIVQAIARGGPRMEEHTVVQSTVSATAHAPTEAVDIRNGSGRTGGCVMTDDTYAADSTALLIIDPYNDFISEGGKIWPRISAVAEANHCVQHMLEVLQAARNAGLRVFYALHRRYRPGDY